MRAQSWLAAVGLWAVLSAGAAAAQTPAVAPASVETPASAKSWLDNRAAIEAYLRDTEIVSIEELKIGVTHPRRAKFPDGGLVQYMAFKNVPPGIVFCICAFLFLIVSLIPLLLGLLVFLPVLMLTNYTVYRDIFISETR